MQYYTTRYAIKISTNYIQHQILVSTFCTSKDLHYQSEKKFCRKQGIIIAPNNPDLGPTSWLQQTPRDQHNSGTENQLIWKTDNSLSFQQTIRAEAPCNFAIAKLNAQHRNF